MQYFLRYEGTKTYVRRLKSGQRVRDIAPVDPTKIIPRVFDSEEEAKDTGRYIERVTGRTVEIVPQPHDWREPEEVAEPTPKPEPEKPQEPKPEPPASDAPVSLWRNGQEITSLSPGPVEARPNVAQDVWRVVYVLPGNGNRVKANNPPYRFDIPAGLTALKVEVRGHDGGNLIAERTY